ncbi:MAG: hypothetical protein ACYSUI_21185 [Planctomycetota bacterium]
MSGLALVMFAGPTPPAVAPGNDDVASQWQGQPLVAELSWRTGDDLVLGWIKGTVYVNDQAVDVKGSVAVSGGLVGSNTGTGITIMQPEVGSGDRAADPELHDRVTIEGWVFIVPDSWLYESAVLSEPGDGATIEVNFSSGGYLIYEISVVSADPPVYGIRLSGDLKGEPAMPELPWYRGLNFYWHKDGTISGDGYASGKNSDGEPYFVSAVISGRYFAANPAVRLPAKVAGTLAITDFDPKTGHWDGHGSGDVTGDTNGDGLIND